MINLIYEKHEKHPWLQKYLHKYKTLFFLISNLTFQLYSPTVKSHFKTQGLYNFIRGLGCAYKRGGGAYIRTGLISEIKKCFGTTR